MRMAAAPGAKWLCIGPLYCYASPMDRKTALYGLAIAVDNVGKLSRQVGEQEEVISALEGRGQGAAQARHSLARLQDLLSRRATDVDELVDLVAEMPV